MKRTKIHIMLVMAWLNLLVLTTCASAEAFKWEDGEHYVLGTGQTHITIEFQPTAENWVSEIELYTNKEKLVDALIELRLITGFVDHPYSMETVFGVYEDYGGPGGYWVVCYMDDRMGTLAFPPDFGRLELAPIQTGDRFYIYLEGSLNEEDWPEGWTYEH